MDSTLKQDIDNLAKALRESEEKMYQKINQTDKDMSEVATNLKLLVQKVSTFIEMFEKHDQTEMQKYTNIEGAIVSMEKELKQLEDKYVTKDELADVKSDIKEISVSVKKGFKIFWIGCGVFMTLGTIGSLAVWVVNLLTKINQLGG